MKSRNPRQTPGCAGLVTSPVWSRFRSRGVFGGEGILKLRRFPRKYIQSWTKEHGLLGISWDGSGDGSTCSFARSRTRGFPSPPRSPNRVTFVERIRSRLSLWRIEQRSSWIYLDHFWITALRVFPCLNMFQQSAGTSPHLRGTMCRHCRAL